MKLLVCEGPCSPATPEYDAAIRQHRTAYLAYARNYDQDIRNLDRQAAAKARAAEIGRCLVHTPHVEQGGKRYACLTCGTVREF